MKIKKVLSFFIVCISILFILKYIIVHSNFDALIVMSVKLSLYTEHFFVFIQNNVTKDVITIALTVLAGNLTIFAFAYPYIYKSLDSIGKISEILLERVRENFWIKWYWLFLLILFIFSICFLLSYFFTKRFSPWFSIITLILLFIHICYVMMLYEIIKKTSAMPLNFLKFKRIKDKKILEKDVNLLRDLFLFYLNTGLKESKLTKYLEYFTNLTICSLNKYFNDTILNVKYWDSFFAVQDREVIEYLLLPFNRMVFLNKRSVDSNHEELFYCIDVFFKNMLYYAVLHNENIQNNKEFIKTYPKFLQLYNKFLDIKQKMEVTQEKSLIFQHDNIIRFSKYLNKEILAIFSDVILSYRIEKKIFYNYNVEDISFIIVYSIKNIDKENDIYKNSFSLLTKLIDFDYDEKFFTIILDNIQKRYFLEYAQSFEVYNKVMIFHIIVLAYMFFRNKYDLFITYINFEENSESTNVLTRPQIPRATNMIFLCFIGQNCVFDNIKIFSKNISSERYKIFTFFALLINSKNYADVRAEKLKTISKDDFYHKFYERELDSYSIVSNDIFNGMCWDEILITDIKIFKSFNKYLEEFAQNEEFTRVIKFNNEHRIFIKNNIDEFIKIAEQKRDNILKTDIKLLLKEELSLLLSKESNCKNIEEYMNNIFYDVINELDDINKELSIVTSNDINICLIKKLISGNNEYNKNNFLKIIANNYKSIFVKDIKYNLYTEIIRELYKKCKTLKSISEVSKEEDFSKYIIVTNSLTKKSFNNILHIEDCNIICDKNTNRVLKIKINEQEVSVSKLSEYFKTEKPSIILLDKSKFNIVKNQNIKIKFEDIEDNKIRIYYEKIFEIQTIEESIGYIIS